MSTLLEALKYHGQSEVRGPASNSFILDMQNKALKKYGLKSGNDDDFPWCAIFVSFILNETGVWNDKWLIRAMDFKKEFEKVPAPIIGKTLTVLWRESPTSGKGHIGWSINEYQNMTNILAGNQGNSINIAGFSKSRLDCYLLIP